MEEQGLEPSSSLREPSLALDQVLSPDRQTPPRLRDSMARWIGCARRRSDSGHRIPGRDVRGFLRRRGGVGVPGAGLKEAKDLLLRPLEPFAP